MKVSKIEHISPADTIDIVNQLRNQGYTQGKDFDFAYHQARYDNDGWSAVTPKSANFTFYNDLLATWFTLKYNDYSNPRPMD